jgi:hypothetical protein
MNTNQLIDLALNWAVARANGNTGTFGIDGWNPSTNWAQGGPIIEREKIAILSPMTGEFWDARDGKRLETPFVYWRGPTPLIAAMRCYVASKLGEEVDVPEELK